MGATFLLLAALQIPQAQPAAPHPPRFSVGAHFNLLGGFIGEGAGVGLAGGIGTSIPVGRRTAIDLRVTSLLPSDGFALWDVRWHRTFGSGSGARPYFAAGLAGVVYEEIRYRNNVRREEWKFWKPPMLSLAGGQEPRAGRHFTVPLEVGVMLHPYGLILGTITVGLNWTPGSR